MCINNYKNYIFVINGVPKSGKDTFVEYCKNHLKKTNYHHYNISSVDKVKKAAKLLGWNGEKDKNGRKFLQYLKQISTQFYQGPLNYMDVCVTKFKKPYIAFFHIREPKEIDKFLVVHENAKTILVTREGVEVFVNDSDSECYIFQGNYNWKIENNGTKRELSKSAKKFLERLGIL